MIEFLKKLFGMGPETDFQKLKMEGAVIVDVRSKQEYKQGHIKDSLNIPLDTLQNNLTLLKSKKTIITCCASGMRSRMANTILKKNGFTSVYNGGGWNNLEKKLLKSKK